MTGDRWSVAISSRRQCIIVVVRVVVPAFALHLYSARASACKGCRGVSEPERKIRNKGSEINWIGEFSVKTNIPEK
jgi:hypothetical protein